MKLDIYSNPKTIEAIYKYYKDRRNNEQKEMF